MLQKEDCGRVSLRTCVVCKWVFISWICLHCIAWGAFMGALCLLEWSLTYAGVNGLFVVHPACFHPALRARLNLPHSHRLQMSMSGLDRVDNGWHSVHIDCTNIYYREPLVIVMKQCVNKSVRRLSTQASVCSSLERRRRFRLHKTCTFEGPWSL